MTQRTTTAQETIEIDNNMPRGLRRSLTEKDTTMYAPAVIPNDLASTYTGTFWTAANNLTGHDDDVITAATRAAAVNEHHARIIEQLAVNRAQKLHPTSIDPHNPPTRWTWWQHHLSRLQSWTVLATLADEYASHDDHLQGLRSGTWQPAPTTNE